MKQTHLYVCTLEEFILEDLHSLLYKLDLIYIGKYTGFIQLQQWVRNALEFQLSHS